MQTLRHSHKSEDEEEEWYGETSKSTFHNFPQVCTKSSKIKKPKILIADLSQKAVGKILFRFHFPWSPGLQELPTTVITSPDQRSTLTARAVYWQQTGWELTWLVMIVMHFTLVKILGDSLCSHGYTKFLLGWFCSFMLFPLILEYIEGEFHPIIVCFGVCSGVFVCIETFQSCLQQRLHQVPSTSTVKSIR